MKKVILVSTCTNTKTASVSEKAKLENCKKRNFSDAVKEWSRTLAELPESTVRASELYSGTHWTESLAAYGTLESSEKCVPELWILSAGYGLIPGDALVQPYSATFAGGPDSIHELVWEPELSAKDRSYLWWEELNACKPEAIPRTLPCIDDASDTLWIVVLSKEYMPAVEQELFELVSSGRRVLVISAGAYGNVQSLHPVLQPRLFPLSEKFETYRQSLHGAKVALNANFVHWLTVERLDELIDDPDALLASVGELDKSLPDPASISVEEFVRLSKECGSDLPTEELEHLWTKRNRQTLPMTDEEVLAFIKLHYEPGISSATKLLRKLRHEEGRSCEQKRFGALFKNYENRNQLSLFDE